MIFVPILFPFPSFPGEKGVSGPMWKGSGSKIGRLPLYGERG